MERDRVELFEYASTEAVRALLPILDDFERGLKVASADREYASGMELIYQRLYDSLKKLGLEPVLFTTQERYLMKIGETEIMQAAERNAAQSCALSVSISMNPVAAGTSYSTAMRPDTGVQPSCTEKKRISSSAHQKIGIE